MGIIEFRENDTRARQSASVVFKHTLEHFSIEELADAIIVIGFYKMLSGFIQTFNLPADPKADGNLVKG